MGVDRVPALSQRFEAILSLVRPCRTLVDIGTDHGLIPLAAIARHLATTAIAIDRQPAPLQVAEANRRAAALEDKLDLRLGDGLAPLRPGEGDTLTIAGMGARLIVTILRAHPDTLTGFSRLILQPNQQPEQVRAWAREAGWHLADEALVEEAGRFFPVLAFIPGTGPDPAYALPGFSADELLVLGPRLLEKGDAVARRFWQAQRDRLTRLPGDGPRALAALYARALG